MHAYRRAWTSANRAAGLATVALVCVAVAVAEPAFAAAVRTFTAVAAHVETRLGARSARAPSEVGMVVRIALRVIATLGLVGLLGSVTWALLAALAVAGLPLLRSQPCRCELETTASILQTASETTDPQDRDRMTPASVSAADNGPAAKNDPPAQETGVLDRWASTTYSLSTSELRRAWSRIYVAMPLTTAPRQLARISQARQVYPRHSKSVIPSGSRAGCARQPSGP